MQTTKTKKKKQNRMSKQENAEQKSGKKRRKWPFILLTVAVVLVVGAYVVMRLLGRAHVGVGNNPEPQVKGESRVLVAYFS